MFPSKISYQYWTVWPAVLPGWAMVIVGLAVPTVEMQVLAL